MQFHWKLFDFTSFFFAWSFLNFLARCSTTIVVVVAASQGLKFRDVGNKTLLKKEFAVNGSCIKNLKMGVQIEMLEKSRFWTIFCECYNLVLVEGAYDEIGNLK